MQHPRTPISRVRATLLAGALASTLVTGTAFADHGQPHGRGNLPAVAQSHIDQHQSTPQGQQGHEDERGNRGEASLMHRKGFPGLVTKVNANGNQKNFEMLLALGGEEHTILVEVNEDTRYRGKDHQDIEDAANEVTAFFTMLQSLMADADTEVRANVRGELEEQNNKLKLVAKQVSLHEIPEDEDN